MSVQITSYAGINSAVQAWMARSGDAVLSSRFDDFLALAERRIYYGYATDDTVNPLRSDPLRIPEMELTVQTSGITTGATTIAQPADFLELVSVYNTNLNSPMEIVAQRVIDGYGNRSIGGTKLISVSGANFRIWDAAPAALVLTMHYYQKLATPTASAANAILTNYPDIYLYACLTEAAIYTQDAVSAQAYLMTYNASVSGLNARTQRITASANPIIRVRGGMTP